MVATLFAVAGTLLGVVMGWLLSARSQQKAWRKEEWRELFSTLERCQQTIKRAKVNTPGGLSMYAFDQIREAQLEGARVIQDRLFIQKLSDLAGPKIAAPPESAFSVTVFNTRWAAMHSKLLGLARRDLGL